jgi:hypothetical protein
MSSTPSRTMPRMSSRAPRSRIALVATALLTAHCGARQTPAVPSPTTTAPETPAQPAAAPADAGTPDAAAAALSPTAAAWARLGPTDLQRIVREGALARLAQVAPQFDYARLADYAQNPASAPELPGRAVERLLDLAVVELAANNPANAERIIRVVRARARNRNSAYIGNTILAEAKRRQAGDDPAAQQRAIEESFRELPPVRFNAATVFYQLFQRPQQLAARLGVVQRSMVTMETAKDALYYSVVAPEIVANRERYLAAIASVRAANEARPARAPYNFATVDLTGARDAREVRIAVWDLGTNPELFREQLFTNAAEQANGRDDDGNGQADDIHGLVADGNAPNTALLFDPGQDTITRYAPYLRGVMDLRAGMASTPAAQQVLELVRTVTDADQQRELDRRLDAIGEWSHGTHVAGIMTAGVPQARLAIFRSAWAGERRLYEDRGPTDAELDAERANMEAVCDYIRRHNVRVVNASLGFSLEYLENELRHETERYHSDDEVRARARQVHDRRREFWRNVFARCPDTLFVVAAGNSNEDVVEYEELPASLEAPNLITVGAVDRFGDWALFTNSNPERVRIFDHGVEVDSVIPNGERVPLSGTSMASPNVANLAAKLFAVNPALTPARAAQIIVETGDPIAAPFNGRIANETRALERARRERPRGARAR